jgi:breakpoint cluster region protein
MFTELLRKPVDKLQNYSLVLKDLLKYTPRDHGDFELLQSTSQAVSDLLRSINRGPTETEGKRPLKSEVVVQLTENGRKFRQLCLFEDVLLCVKQKGSGRQRKYECKWYLPLTELTFHPPPDAEVPGPITRTNSQELESLQAKIGKLKYEMRQEQTEKRKGTKLTAVKSNSKLDRLKKKLRELEASLRLSKADLPLRLFDIEGKAYTLLFCDGSERIAWQEKITATKETAKPVQISPYDLEALIRRSRKSLRQSDSMRSIQIEADNEEEFLSGMLHVQVHSAKGIIASRQGKPDLFCTLSVDCYGRFDKKAKTHVLRETISPVWEEEFDIEVEGAQNIKIACFDRRHLLLEDQCGKGQVELLKLGIKDGRKHPVEVKLIPKGSIKLSVMYTTRVQSLSRKPSSSDSALFGVPISPLCQREGRKVPYIVTCCCEEIERRGLDEVGIYRVSGVASDVRSLKQAFEQDSSEATKMAAEIDIHAVSGLVKMFFRELPEPLFTNELYPRLVDGIALGEPEAKKRFMASLVQSLPPVNLATMVYLFRHLRKVASEERVNKMSLNNLSTVFGPNLLRPSMDGTDHAAIAAMSHVGILLYLLQMSEELLLSPSAQASSSLTHFQFPTIEEELDSESVQ